MIGLSLYAARELVASMISGSLAAVVRAGDGERGEVVFIGGRLGEHRLSLPDSDENRVRAHWAGYLRANGAGEAQPPAQLSLLGGAS